MSDDSQASLDAFCRAIRDDDLVALPSLRKAFVAKNWSLVTALDRLAQADQAALDFKSAREKLSLLEKLLPDNSHMFIRRVGIDIRNGVPGAFEELAGSVARLASDGELFHVTEELVSHGRQDLASKAIGTAAGRNVFSAGILAACRCRVLAATGRLTEALEIVSTDAVALNVTAMRCRYLLLEQLLDFDASHNVNAMTALQWGEERDLRYAIDHLLYFFNCDAAESLLERCLQRHPTTARLVAILRDQIAACRGEIAKAVSERGPPDFEDRTIVFAALSDAGTSPSRILWGKLSLAALLESDALTEADYARFAWFLPNWEQAPVRNRVLGAARRLCPDAPAVQRGWLHYLIANAAYGDAALHCQTLLRGPTDEDTLFFIVVLLRLQQDAIVPAFMEAALFATLRDGLLQRVPSAEAGFRCVMHDHFVALGAPPQPWTREAMPPYSDHDQRGFRRLLAVTPGRLNRVSTPIAASVAGKLRPVVAISGQLRGFETAWPSLREKLVRATGAPVLMSVWDKTVNARGRHARRLERMLPDDLIARLKPEERYTDTFEVAYPRTAQLLFGHTDVHAGDVRALLDADGVGVLGVETESEILLEQVLHPNINANMLKMYYKFARLEFLLRAAEIETGAIFSHVIWARPDCEVVRLSHDDLFGCLGRTDIAWSSFVTETSFGDYCMILPRHAFSVLGGIFARVCLAGDTRLLPWRPNRAVTPNARSSLDAFGGPDVFFDILLAAGYMPVSRVPRMGVLLRGRTPGAEVIKKRFEEECSPQEKFACVPPIS